MALVEPRALSLSRGAGKELPQGRVPTQPWSHSLLPQPEATAPSGACGWKTSPSQQRWHFLSHVCLSPASLTKTHYEEKEEVMRRFLFLIVAFLISAAEIPMHSAQRLKNVSREAFPEPAWKSRCSPATEMFLSHAGLQAQPRHSCTSSAHLQTHPNTPRSRQECAHSNVWVLPPAQGVKPNH